MFEINNKTIGEIALIMLLKSLYMCVLNKIIIKQIKVLDTKYFFAYNKHTSTCRYSSIDRATVL